MKNENARPALTSKAMQSKASELTFARSSKSPDDDPGSATFEGRRADGTVAQVITVQRGGKRGTWIAAAFQGCAPGPAADHLHQLPASAHTALPGTPTPSSAAR
jgi:hypothetical protein